MVLTTVGKTVRWSRFASATSGRSLIVPIDHGLTMGPIEGLSSVAAIGRWMRDPAINGVIAHKGLVARLGREGLLAGRGVMVHLNGATSIGEEPDTKHLLTSVDHAVRLGADGVSVQVNFRPDNHSHNLGVLGRVVDEAERYGLPVLAMVYPAGVVDDEPQAMARHRHFLRIAFEMGIDAVKTAPPTHLEDIPELLDGVDDLGVLFSGGSLGSDESLISLAKAVANSGGAGLCVGRNVFQRQDPSHILAQLRDVLDS
jgi:class I fructose-bisphosphate aldolase/fructose-bisphosphate aldolase/2-amino-3,7-dideoxy-D-threo-hept-6-ulosonate synthase